MMTESWSSRFWKLGLVSSLAISGVITSPGSWALESSGDHTLLDAECSVNTPNTFINSLSVDQIEAEAITGTGYLSLAEALNRTSSSSAVLQSQRILENENISAVFSSDKLRLTVMRCPCNPSVKRCCLVNP